MEADRKFTQRDRDRLKVFLAGYNSGAKVLSHGSSIASATGRETCKMEVSESILLNIFFEKYFQTEPDTGNMKKLAKDFVFSFYIWQFTTAAQYKQEQKNHSEFIDATNTLKGLTIK